MDRNNFLFFGHKITLLKILTAIGKLDTKIISVIKAKLGLPYCTVVNNYLWVCFAGVSDCLHTETNHRWTGLYKGSAGQKESYLLYNKSFRDNFSFFKTIILKYLSLEVVNLLPNRMDGIHNPVASYKYTRLCGGVYKLDENRIVLSKNTFIKNIK
ncbi:hypothetical protein LIV57_14480 [Chryseobacterium sp. X308]|uniref:hypothetical protein n=1 Tax=Chryseobacterium sp. X308 TaxID=2884873 RepID=UPI001D135E48|nr:hypothetical protein [Chryseobacterium sp. X308]MCC3216469.1 hypothetical protein [Chryseobacterium sp. X308]